MPRNGSGTFNLVSNSWNPAVNGVSATAADYQTLINDVAAAITQSVSVDGQAPMTGNLPMGNNKITGLAVGTANTDAAAYGQVGGLFVTVASASTVNLDSAAAANIDITGTTTINAITLGEGKTKIVRFTGALTLTAGASLLLPGGSSFVTAAGDFAIFVGRAAGVVACVSYQLNFQAPASFTTWSTGSPTLVPQTGAFTSASAAIRYKINGKTVFFSLVVTIITNGTGAGSILVTMPWAAASESGFAGRESQSAGWGVIGTMSAASTTLNILKYDGTYPGGSSFRMAINGVMETT